MEDNLEKDFEEKKDVKKVKISKKSIIICLIIIAIAIIIVSLVITKRTSNVVGNTIGNIRNYGYIVTDDNYLYFMSPNDEGSALGIRKIDKNNLSGESEMLIEDNWQIVGLNYMDGYLYFITMADPEDSDSDDIVDNKIHKMKTDGSDHTIINDNEFNNDCYEIYVVKDKLYYIGIDECIYYMDLDGNNKTKLNDNASGFLGITEDYIFFNKIIESDDTETNDTETGDTEVVSDVPDYETYMMNLDGSNEHAILEGQKLYNINVVGDYIYYQTQNGYPSKVKIDGTENTMISDEVAYNMNVTEEGIFYLNYYQIDDTNAGVAVYRMDLDGSNVTQLAKLDTYSEMLCEFGDWLYYSDSDNEVGRFELISKDGKQSITLYSLDLSVYYEDDETDSENTTEGTDQTNTVSEDTSNITENTTNE